LKFSTVTGVRYGVSSAPDLSECAFEILLDSFAAGITDGPGNWLVGGRVFGRYNFIQPGARVVPYLQVSAGALGNDIYLDHTQKIIGGGFEFTTGVSTLMHTNEDNLFVSIRVHSRLKIFAYLCLLRFLLFKIRPISTAIAPSVP
jgi:hypothetical protein